jgi:hypothetical protein
LNFDELNGCSHNCCKSIKQFSDVKSTKFAMVQSELDSFYVKFKHLLRAERDATLTIKSVAGRAVITLSLDLGHVLSEPGHQPHHPRNGPSRQRRREKRAAACEQKVAAEEVELTPDNTENVSKVSESTENVENKDVATNIKDTVEKTDAIVTEEVNANPVDEVKKDTEQVGSIDDNDLVVDEFCSNASYNGDKKEPIPSTPPSRPSRGLGSVDYLSMRFEDFCDPD